MHGNRTTDYRLEAVRRYQAGESATAICHSLGKSRQWLYKWLQRKDELQHVSDPIRAHNRTPIEIEQAVIDARKKLQSDKYAQIGVNAINRRLYLQGIPPLPETTIKRILRREGLVRKRRPYAPKGKAYPKPEAVCANNIHQADIVGPRFIKGDGRFYSLNVMDIATHRVTVSPSRRKDDESMATGLIRTWKTLGIPDFLQMDNELSFRGSNRYPHSLGLILRLSLLLKIQPVFIPQGEPWRNGEIESFQNTFDKAFFRSQVFRSFKELCCEAPRFENYHNEHYIYSCLKGKTPNRAVQQDSIGISLLPESFRLPHDRIPIEDGYIHFYRFIRSDRQLGIFGEKFTVPKNLVYEYVIATICTDIHTLHVRHDDQLIEAYEYVLPVDRCVNAG
jgi:transposase InsO family protein